MTRSIKKLKMPLDQKTAQHRSVWSILTMSSSEKATQIFDNNDDDFVTDDEESVISDGDVDDEIDKEIEDAFRPEDETILDRIYALRDIIPPSTRSKICKGWKSGSNLFSKGTRFAGNVIWVVSTSAVLIGLPLAIAIENESLIVQQEREYQQQQTGAQQLNNPFGSPNANESHKGLLPPGL